MLKILGTGIGTAAVALAVSMPASALPIPPLDTGPGVCDIQPVLADHELGPGATTAPTGDFPADEQISFSLTTVEREVSPDCGLGLADQVIDTIVLMRNDSTHDWVDLWFVSDSAPFTFHNVDMVINFADAMRIDDIGLNQPLIGGDDGDLIFEMGETWQFVVQDWVFPGAINFHSPGLVGTNSLTEGAFGPVTPIGRAGPSNASIIARLYVELPEPGALALIGLGLAGLGFASRRKAKA